MATDTGIRSTTAMGAMEEAMGTEEVMDTEATGMEVIIIIMIIITTIESTIDI